MSYNNEDLEAFLVEADLINQKVKALAQNRMSPQEFDRLEMLRQQDRQRKQQLKLRKQQQIIKKKQLGCEGKGISKDFKNFCYYCRWQYELQTPKCLKCQKKTMTLEQRQKQLQIMVSVYKYKKKNRQERKHRWDMWKKTQSSLWKNNNSNNYSKWQYFVSDSQQQTQQQPIVPKNDPNFMALEADLEERKKRKQKDHLQAKKLKQKGNKLIRQGNFEQAMHKYTLALEHAKDIKSIYTNRALAFIKLGKFKKAIKDCSNVIQYMEIFQKIGQNKDITFKAYSRRALARKQIKQYKIGLQDIKQALKLYPQDKSALLLKKELEGLSDHAQKVQKLLRQNVKTNPQKSTNQTKMSEDNQVQHQEQQQQMKQVHDQMDEESIKKQQRQIVKQLIEKQTKQSKQSGMHNIQQKLSSQHQDQQGSAQTQNKSNPQNTLNPIQQIKRNVQNLTAQNIKETFDLMIRNKDMITIFIAAKGIEACLKSLLSSQFSNSQALLISLCFDGSGVGQKSVWDFGIDKIHNKITLLLDDTNNQKHHVYQIIEDLFQIVISVSLYEPYRIKLSCDSKVHLFIEQTYTKLISKRKNRTHSLSLFVIYMSNLLSGPDSGLKNTYLTKQKFTTLIDSFFVLILDQQSQNRIFLDLKKNIYGLIANMASHPEHRKTTIDFFLKNDKFSSISQQLQQYPKNAHNFTEYIQAILSVMVNTTFQTNLQLPQLTQVLFTRFIKGRKAFSTQITYRSLLVMSRLKLSDPQMAGKWLQTFEQIGLEQDPLANPAQKCNMVQIVKLLNVLYTPVSGLSLTAQIPKKLFQVLSKYVSDNLVHQNLFCNTANLFGVIAISNLSLKQKVYEQVALSMKRLVFISKQKIGNWRKNAAILIAKCSSNPKCKQSMQKQHAMDVLKTIAHLISAPK